MAAIKTAKTYVQIGLGLEAFKEVYPEEEIPFMLMGAIGASPTILQRYREGKSSFTAFLCAAGSLWRSFAKSSSAFVEKTRSYIIKEN